MPKVNYSGDSPYAKTQQTIWYLSNLTPRYVPRDGTDRDFTIPARFNKRPDNAASELFGSPELWWTFAMLNPNVLVDPLNDFTTGTVIRIPTRERLKTIL